MKMKMPRYALIDWQPVKALRAVDGNVTVRSFDFQNKEFSTNMSFLTQMVLGYGNIKFINRPVFDEYVEMLQKIGSTNG